MRTFDGYDVVVTGGGPGGACAAVAAARAGARTLLLEREGCLGGGMTTMMVCPFMSHRTNPGPDEAPGKVVNAGLFREVCDRMIARGQAHEGRCVRFDDEAAKIVLDELAGEAGVEVIFHAALFDAETDGRRVAAATFAHNGGPLRVEGTVFIDATGDALLAAQAGAEVAFGTETHRVMPMTTKFIVGGVDIDQAPSGGELRRRAADGADDEPPLINTNVSCLAAKPEKCWMHFNAIRMSGLSTIDPADLSTAEVEGRRRVENFVAWLRANVPGYGEAYLVKTAPHVGIRESRRVMGDYVLSYDDFKNCRTFDDGIACCSYMIDIHGDEPGQTRLERLGPGQYYQIPYRCLTPKGLENLLVAGRSISADIEAHSSLRIMPPVMNIGQAAGQAAAMARPSGDVRDIDVQKLRQGIRDAGGVLEPE